MHRKSTQQRQLAKRGFFGRLAHAFRERQIYVRSRGEVQFITIKPYMLVVGLFVVLTSFFWLAFASINVTFKDELIAVKERRIYQNKLNHEDRIADLRKQIDQLNAKLLLDQKGYLGEVDKVHRQYQSLVERHNRLSGFFRQGWMPVKSVLPLPSKQNTSTNNDNNDGQSNSYNGGFTNGKSNKGRNGKQSFAPNQAGKSNFNELTYAQKYASVFTTKKEILAPLAELRKDMTGFDTLQMKLLDEVAVYAIAKTKNTGKIFRRLGVNPEQILKTAKLATADSVGGPFIAASSLQSEPTMVAERLKKAITALNKMKLLRQQSKKLPLAIPIKNIKRISSRFGLRRDPFRRVAAMHTGIDIKAPYRAKIKNPAPGLVIYAGWGGGYGRMVKIKHANGIETRYAHMAKILVKKGQYVKTGQAVGLLGNSGRSTGAHLHYETRVNGRPTNPSRFWKARNDFQSLSQKK